MIWISVQGDRRGSGIGMYTQYHPPEPEPTIRHQMTTTSLCNLLPLLPRPSHYLGTEVNAVHKDQSAVSLHWGLAFPDLYDVGMSHLGLKILSHILNQRPHILAERVFAPSPEAAKVMQTHHTPLGTMESKTPLLDLDILGISLTHELCYTTVLWMFDLAGIPFRAQDRDASFPLIAGGGGACFNPEPVAPFFDLFVVGDGEDVVLELSDAVLEAKDSGRSRESLLEDLRHLPGIYVPEHFQWPGPGQALRPVFADTPRVEKRLQPDLNPAPFPAAHIVPFGKTVHDRLTLEVARGCTRGCRFCQAGMTMRPVRERNLNRLDELVQAGLDSTGFEELSFLSLSTGDFSQLESLFAQTLTRCREEQVAISLPSLRVGSVSPYLMHCMASLRRTGATIAPEAGSQRLRDVINKGITEPALLEHARTLFASGWRRLKLYFMIGLPTETEADLQAIYDLCLRVLDAAGADRKRVQLTASLSLFVPKPHTPFQWEAQDDLSTAEEKIAFLRSLFRRPKNLTLRWHEPRMSCVEGIFSRGDRSLAPLLEQAYAAGDVLTSWQEYFSYPLWEEVFAPEGEGMSSFLAARDTGQALPWSHITTGVRPSFLLQEREKAYRQAQTKDCRYHGCSRCGVCTLEKSASELAVQAQRFAIQPVVNRDRRDQEDSPRTSAAPGASDWERKAAGLLLTFAKTGPAAFLSQLELQTVLERLFRRTGLPLSFSKGFHPMPRLSFGRALPVGVHSECETCIVGLRHPAAGADICARLNKHSIQGLRFIQARTVSPAHKLEQPELETFRLQFDLPADAAERESARWLAVLNAPEWILTRKTKKGPREIDVCSKLHTVRIQAAGQVEIVFDWREGYVSPWFLVQGLHPDLDLRSMTLCKTSSSDCQSRPQTAYASRT